VILDCAVFSIAMFCAAMVRAVDIYLKTSGCKPFRKMRALFFASQNPLGPHVLTDCGWVLLGENVMTKIAMNS